MFTGNTAVASTFLATACRYVVMLGGHLDPFKSTQPEQLRIPRLYIRKVFWHCYMYDKDLCLRAGLPSVINDDHCDLTLPLGYKMIDEFENSIDGNDYIPGDMRLTIIKSDMIRLLYCASAFRKPDAELLRNIRELDNELEAWRSLIEPHYRPCLADSYRIRFSFAVL